MLKEISCGSGVELLMDYLEGVLPPEVNAALEAHVAKAPSPPTLAWALKELVRSAWLLDDYGDLGNREKLLVAHERFEEATAAIASSLGVER